MARHGQLDGRTALAAIGVACVAAAAAMLAPLDALADRERIALAALAGIVGALAVVGGLFIRRRIAARPQPEEAAEEEFDAPALRREDIHPDAPPRRPIFAVSDLGMPETGKDESEAIPDLLERFERGLARRSARARPAEAGTGAAPAADVDEALRDALGTLKQMASRVQ